jgi:hypothetical protein
VLGGGPLTRTMVAEVVGDRAVDDRPVRRRDLRALLRDGDEQLLLAVVAAVAGVLPVAGPVEFVRRQHDVAHTEVARQRFGLGEFGARQRRRIGGDGDAPIAEFGAAGVQQRRRVDAARERDDGAAQAAQALAQRRELPFVRQGCGGGQHGGSGFYLLRPS